MGSRLRENPEHIFICFCEVVLPTASETQPWILQKYPDEFNNEEILKSVPEFSCPCEFTNDAVQHFSFVLTSLDSKWTYGFCRHAPNQPTLFCFLSFLPWHETFYRLLNQVADLTNSTQAGLLTNFLDILFNTPVPEPGTELHVIYNLKDFHAFCPNYLRLPSIPENRNLTEYFNAVDAHNMMIIFASMLHERRIVITSRKLSRLSACVQAANSLIYPMHWQHIFIPVLPVHLLDYISAPMPFLIGVPSVTMLHVKDNELNEVVVLDADNNKVRTPFKDFETLPPDIVSSLKRRLKNPNMMLGDGVARAFMRALVHLIGGYRDALKMNIGEKITFDKEAFIKTRPPSIQSFLEAMLHLQIFQQFIEDRLEMLNSGTGFSDEFEQEVSSYEVNASTRLRAQYKEWVTTMKKEGGIFLKNVKSRVRDRGKRAYKDIRSKIQEMQRHPSQPDLAFQQKAVKPKSAPSSPTVPRPNAFEFTPRMSYNQNTTKRHGALDSVNLPNSVSVTGIRRYKVLTVDEMSAASEESLSDTEENQVMEPLNMDLIGDLQDILFRRCSTSSDGQVDSDITAISDSQKNEAFATSAVGFDDSFCANDVFLPAPMPPPRTKRKLITSKSSLSRPALENKDTTADTSKDEPLIRLDSLDDDFFDPLKEGSLNKTELTPLPVNVPDVAASGLKDDFPLLNAKLPNSTYFSSGAYLQPIHQCSISQHSRHGMTCFLDSPAQELDVKSCNITADRSETLHADARPPLPPKVGGNLLSKNDRDLLDDYGLSSSPIFKTAPFEEIVTQSSHSVVSNATLPSQKHTNDLFDIFKNDITNGTKESKNRSTWQKFT